MSCDASSCTAGKAAERVSSRRLGLSSTTECAERKAVMTKYADLAKTVCINLFMHLPSQAHIADDLGLPNVECGRIYPA